MAKTFNFNPWQVGDEITALRLNQTGDIVDHPDFRELESNVIDLTMQAYFDGKDISYQGLFFDGFSNSLKVGTLNDLTVDAANKRLLLPTASASAFVLVVGGGGGGGASRSGNSNPVAGGGGGGGQVLDLSNFTLNPGSFSVVIGPAGSGGVSGNGGGSGGNTVFGSLTANGGGGGPNGGNSGPGGPGGTSGNGNAGGSGGSGFNDGSGFKYGGGGGGGNGAVGQAGTRGDFGGSGGAGTVSALNGTEYGHGARGGGGGSGVGGSGQYGDGGGGAQGGGGTDNPGSIGTQGVVIIKYPIGAITATGGSVGNSGGYTIHTFTSDGTFSVTEVNDGSYESILSRFQQAKRSVRLWITRNLAVRYNIKTAISQNATQVKYLTDITGEIGVGDTIDLSDANNIVRERKTVSNVSESGFPTVAFDVAGSAQAGSGSGANVGVAINVANQPNRLIVIFAGSAGTERTVNSVTVNGNPATYSGFSADLGNRVQHLYYYVNPPVGSNSVNVNYNSTNSGRVHALAFYNAAQINPFRQVQTINGNNNSGSSRTITSTTKDMGFDLIASEGGGTFAIGPGQTQRTTQDIERTSTEQGGSSSVVMSWTWTTSGNFLHIAGSIKPAQNEITIDFSPAVSNTSGFATSGFVERVEVHPQVSLVALGGANSFQSMTYIKSIWDASNNEVEDEYTFTIGTDGYDFKAKLALSHIASTGVAYAKRLGCALQNE